MVLDGFDHVRIKLGRLAGDAKGAVAHVPPCAAGNLGQLVRCKRAHPVAVELGQGGKGHVRDVEIEAHTDGICGDEEIHIAVLIHGDLRVARSGA